MKATKFKSSELGAIPNDWEVKRLGEIGEPLMCKRILKSQTFDVGDVPFFKIGTFGGIADAYISRSLYESFRRKYPYPKTGDVLLSAAGTIGRTVVYDGKDAYFQDSNIVWVDNDEKKVLNDYLYWWYKVILWNTEDGGIVTRLYNGNLKASFIAVPPLTEQRRIARALSDVDELISALGKLIEKKRNIKTGAMQQLLTGKTRLPGFGAARAEFKQTELGPIPKDWEVKRLGDVANILDNRRVPLSESQRKSGAFPYCGANGIVDYIDRYEFDEEAVLIAEDGGNFADFATRPIAYKMSGKYWVNNHAHVLTVKACCDLDYLFSYLSHKDITDIISGGTRAKLTRAQLENIIISLPPLAEQKAIAAVLSDIDAEIAALEAKRAKYESIKQGMMQELLTGKTRLKGE